MSSKNSETPLKDRIDWVTVIVPFLAILALCVCFILMPDASKSVLDTIRFILGDTFGLFYLAVGLFVFLLSLYLAFSRFGTIRLGKPDEKPKYPLFVWASMMFTSQPISCFTPSVNGSFTRTIRISQSSVPCRPGPAPTRCSTGVRSRGHSIWYSPSPSALCFM